MANRLAGGLTSDEIPPTALRIGMSGLRRRTGPSGRRNGIGSLSAYTCPGGVYTRDGKTLNFADAMNIIYGQRANQDMQLMGWLLNVVAKWRADPNSISAYDQARAIAKANEIMCAGYAEQITQAALEHRDTVNTAIAESRPLTAAEMGVPEAPAAPANRGIITTPGYSSTPVTVEQQTAAAGAAANDAALDTASLFSTWFSGGGSAPGGAAAFAESLPDVLKTEEGGVNWLLIAAVAAGGYFLLKKK